VWFLPGSSVSRVPIARRIEGTVTVEAFAGIDGTIKVLRVVKKLGYGLDENAVAAVQQWRFAPAWRNGAVVDVVAQIDIDFRLPPEALLQVKGKKK
jgi:TonB family protein